MPVPVSPVPAAEAPRRFLSAFPLFPGRAFVLPALVLGALLVCTYGFFHQRYLWGVDSFGYVELGKLFSEGRLFWQPALPVAGHPALVPMGFKLNAANLVIPEYPPGFPLLLAIGHWLHAPMWVTPVVGAISAGLLFLLLRARTSATVAFLLSLGWALMPQTVAASTLAMSDIVATACLLGALLAFRSGRIPATAWLLGFSFAVRPANVLFLLPFALLLRPDRTFLRFVLHLIPPCGLYALYNDLVYGAPWRTGYGNVADNLTTSIFRDHFWFYVSVTPAILSPLIILLAGLGVWRWNREKAFLVAWPLAFMLFYGTWAGGGIDRWWWARFILPAYPAFYLLAGDGVEHLGRWLERLRAPRARQAAGLALLAALLAVPAYGVRFGLRNGGGIWSRDVGVPNYRAVERVSAVAPPGSLVGSAELASTFASYSSLVPFVSIFDDAPDLIGSALADGRRVFLLVEPWNADNPAIVRTRARFQLREIARFDFLWEGLPFYEVTSR